MSYPYANMNWEIGKSYHYWVIEGINKTEGYLGIKIEFHASLRSTQTGKLEEIYFDRRGSISDICINLKH